ncbi:MAG: SCO family protein [Acidimicrobiales bacterium]
MSTPLAPPERDDDAFRAAALRAGRTPVPRRFIFLVAAAFVVLGGGGVLLERAFGSTGTPTPPTTTAPREIAPPSPAAILGARTLSGAPAPAIALLDQSGQVWSLSAHRGRTTLVAFVNASCNDICPVLGAELRHVQDDLGSRAPNIVIVNTDPRATTVAARPPALVVPQLTTGRVWFLTGSLRALTAVWTAYGIQVRLTSASAVSVHNDVIYLIDARGRLRDAVTPFANETRAGHFWLDATTERSFATALASLAGRVNA